MSHLVRGVCPHDCPDSCAWIVTVDDGRAVRMAGDPDHSFTNGFLCTKVARYVERTYHADRLLFPQIRVGAKGEGKFRRASWDEALALIAERYVVHSSASPATTDRAAFGIAACL
jgi:anaerobic selenocysteine-containing dehydrogenase